MARFSFASLALGLAACGNAQPVDAPRAEAPVAPLSLTPELFTIDPYAGGPDKDVGPALITNTPQRRPEAGSLDHALLVFSKVPLERFQHEVAPVVGKELRLPLDAAVVWRRASAERTAFAVVISTHPLATFDDIASAEAAESREHDVRIANGKVTERDITHIGVQVAFDPAASARIGKYEQAHPGQPLVVAYDGWEAGRSASRDDGTFYFRFSWLDDEAAATKAAADFVAAVNSRRRRR